MTKCDRFLYQNTQMNKYSAGFMEGTGPLAEHTGITIRTSFTTIYPIQNKEIIKTLQI